MSDRLRIVFVSGLSGSGKSTAMAALEDLSFYCVDHLPVQLIEQFLGLCAQATPPTAASRAVVVRKIPTWIPWLLAYRT